MKALILCGSTRRGGCTEAACEGVSEGLKGSGWDPETVFLSDLDIGHYGSTGDDMDIVMKRFREADLVVMATPIYFSGPSSLLKAVVDRMNPYWEREAPHPDRMVAVLVGGSREPNFGNTLSILRSLCNTVGGTWGGELCLGGSDSDGADRFRSEGIAFGNSIVGETDP